MYSKYRVNCCNFWQTTWMITEKKKKKKTISSCSQLELTWVFAVEKMHNILEPETILDSCTSILKKFDYIGFLYINTKKVRFLNSLIKISLYVLMLLLLVCLQHNNDKKKTDFLSVNFFFGIWGLYFCFILVA